MDDFDREVRERLDVPLYSPYSLTPYILVNGLICILLLWLFDAASWVVPASLISLGVSFVRWFLSRRRVRETFHLLAKKAHLEHPGTHTNEILLGVLSAWRLHKLPPIRVFFASDTKSKWIFEDGHSPPAE